MKRTLEAELLRWKRRGEHLPILLRGARQVGKSYLVEQFGKANFERVAVADFERFPSLKDAFDTRDPKEIVAKLELAAGIITESFKRMSLLRRTGNIRKFTAPKQKRADFAASRNVECRAVFNPDYATQFVHPLRLP